mmetsp:Transcript_16126/g.26083  ORF Transcript_16126/g.26083 Transcript_16126/m.26083 type:complete len:244 (+) Transcript_16126:405-1136(+)
MGKKYDTHLTSTLVLPRAPQRLVQIPIAQIQVRLGLDQFHVGQFGHEGVQFEFRGGVVLHPYHHFVATTATLGIIGIIGVGSGVGNGHNGNLQLLGSHPQRISRESILHSQSRGGDLVRQTQTLQRVGGEHHVIDRDLIRIVPILSRRQGQFLQYEFVRQCVEGGVGCAQYRSREGNHDGGSGSFRDHFPLRVVVVVILIAADHTGYFVIVVVVVIFVIVGSLFLGDSIIHNQIPTATGNWGC